MSEGSDSLYGLSFGDWNEKWNRINDRVVTNNADSQKVLATVAATVIHFMAENPDTSIFAIGSTPSRTRLYQMGIASYITTIRSLFRVEGFIGDEWEPFRSGHNYDAFLLKPKNFLSL